MSSLEEILRISAGFDIENEKRIYIYIGINGDGICSARA